MASGSPRHPRVWRRLAPQVVAIWRRLTLGGRRARERRRKTTRGGQKIAHVGWEAWDCALERRGLRALERGNPARAGKVGSARAGEGKSRPRLHIPLLAGSRAPGSRGKLRSLGGEGREERGEEKRRATRVSTWKPPAPSAQLHPSPPQSPPDPPASGSVTASVRAFPPLPPLVCSSSLPPSLCSASPSSALLCG